MRSLILVAALVAGGCSEEVGVVEVRGTALGTFYSVKYVGPRDDSVTELVDGTLAAVDRAFSTYREDSVISRFNAARHTEPIEVGPRVAALVGRALAIAAATGGAFDPTIRPLTRLHPLPGRTADAAPTDAEIARALECVGWRKLEVVGDRSLRKLHPDVEVDTNAFAKGWAVDEVSAALAARGLADHLVEIGGEVRCRGAKPGGVVWRVAIESPSADGANAEAIELADAALATSGSYRQFFESGGRRVHHIVDPRTGRNAPGQAVSVSVRAGDCTLADALATAFMVTGLDGVEPARAALAEPFGVLFLVRGEGAGLARVESRWR